jgi:hypothetical protein
LPNDIELNAGPLRIAFHWIGDRFAHTISLVEDERIAPLLESIEGAADEPWPASPPLQSLHVERRSSEGRIANPSYEVALLVGMAGDSHWSASVECDPAGALVFDVACRLASRPRRLGAEYCVKRGAPATLQSLLRVLDAQGVRVSAVGAEAGCDSDKLAIHAMAPAGDLSLPTTRRWQYTIRQRRHPRWDRVV